MKKSEQYQVAQFAVLNSPSISPERKLLILKTLMDDEQLALFSESREVDEDA